MTRTDLVDQYEQRIWASVLAGVASESAPPVRASIRHHLHDMLLANDRLEHETGRELMARLAPHILKRGK